MPRLPEYEAPERTLQPSDKGAGAFEQAGRRIGPAFNEAATFTREQGATASQLIQQRKWPFDMLELERSLDSITQARARISRETANTGGVGFKVEGGGTSSGKHGGILDDSTDKSGGKGHKSKSGADVGGMSIAAAGLGRMAAAMAKGNTYRSQTIDPTTGKEVVQPKTYQTLENGVLVRYDAKTGERISKATTDKDGNPIPTGPNAAAQRAAQSWANKDWNDPSIDWANEKANNTDAWKKRQAETSSSGVDPVTGQMQERRAMSIGTPQTGYPGNYGNPPRMPEDMGVVPRYNREGQRIENGQSERARAETDTAEIERYRGGESGASPATRDMLSERDRDPYSSMSDQGAQEARDAVDWTRQNLGTDRTGAGTDSYSPDSGSYEDTGGEVI